MTIFLIVIDIWAFSITWLNNEDSCNK